MRQTWTEGQAITTDDLNNLSKGVEYAMLSQCMNAMLGGQVGFYGNGFKVTWASTTTFTLAAGFGFYNDASQTPPESKYRFLHNETPSTIYTITAAHASLNRIDTVQVRAKLLDDESDSRDVKAPGGMVTPQTLVIRKKWGFELQIKDGTPGSGTAPSADVGWVKIGEVLVTAVTGIANQADITDTRTFLEVYDGGVPNQEVDLWEWDTPKNHTTQVTHNSTTNLHFRRTGTSGTTFAQQFPETSFGSMYWELKHALGRGISLKIIDGAGVEWRIVPRANIPSWTSHVELSGSTTGGTLSLIIKSSGIGVTYDVYRGTTKTSVSNFSTFSALSSGSFNTNSFRQIFIGTSQILKKIGSYVPGITFKRTWIKPLFVTDLSKQTAAPENLNYRIGLETGKTYRATIAACFGSSGGSFFSFMLHNHFTDTTAPFQLYQFSHNTGSAGTYEDMHRSIVFVAVGQDLNLRAFYATGSGSYIPSVTNLTGYYQWGFDYMLIEEV